MGASFQPSASRTKRSAPYGDETFCAKQLLFAESAADISSHRYRPAILSENGIPRPESEIADPGLRANDPCSRLLCFGLSTTISGITLTFLTAASQT